KLAARLRTTGAPQFPAQHYNLTPRELQIAKLMTEYKNNREIADMLYITEGTVRNYISVIYEKIGMNDRTKAIPLLKHALRDFD
ncbi:response regulator transcription factor, partial [Paenibacillus glucanolyticus]